MARFFFEPNIGEYRRILGGAADLCEGLAGQVKDIADSHSAESFELGGMQVSKAGGVYEVVEETHSRERRVFKIHPANGRAMAENKRNDVLVKALGQVKLK